MYIFVDFSTKVIVLLGKGALSMFLTISAHENLPVVLVPLAEEDLLDPDEMDFSSGGFASGEVYFRKSRLNLRRVFLVRTTFNHPLAGEGDRKSVV